MRTLCQEAPSLYRAVPWGSCHVVGNGVNAVATTKKQAGAPAKVHCLHELRIWKISGRGSEVGRDKGGAGS